MNNVKKFLIGTAVGTMLLAGTIMPAGAATPNWDVTGSYSIGFECISACGGPYIHDASMTQTGSSVDGVGGYTAGGPHTYEWDITTGTVSDNNINLTMDYTLGASGTTMNMVGTIAPNGSMSGTWTDNFGGSRNGTWITTSGVAALIVPVECQSMVFTNMIPGTNGSEILNGTPNSDLILAMGGSDVVNGGGGNDCIVGGTGSDRLLGGGGNDVILGGDDSDSIEGNGGDDNLYGEGESDSLDGGGGDDTLSGGTASDSLRGAGGNDTLNGDAGSDAANGQ